jgi:hypothetical protein
MEGAGKRAQTQTKTRETLTQGRFMDTRAAAIAGSGGGRGGGGGSGLENRRDVTDVTDLRDLRETANRRNAMGPVNVNELRQKRLCNIVQR